MATTTNIINIPTGWNSQSMPSEEELLGLAKKVSQAVRSSTFCTADFFDPSEYVVDGTFHENHDILGDRFAQWCLFSHHLEKIRVACIETTNAFKNTHFSGFNTNKRRTIASQSVASFGVAECGELVGGVATKVPQAVIVFSVENQIQMHEHLADQGKDHAIVLAGIDPHELQKKIQLGISHVDALAELQQGIFVDPLLEICCPVRQLRAKGEKFFRYCKLHHIKYIGDVIFDIPREEELASLLKRVIKSAGKKLVSVLKEPLDDPCVIARFPYLAASALSDIRDLFPNFVWITQVNDLGFSLSTQGDSKPIQQCKNTLRAYKVGSISGGEVQLVLTNPFFPLKLRVCAALNDLFRMKTKELVSLIASYI